MPWVALRVDGGERIGVVVGDEIHVARGATRIVDLLGDDGEQLARAADAARRDPERVVARADAALLAPLPPPPTIRAPPDPPLPRLRRPGPPRPPYPRPRYGTGVVRATRLLFLE